MAAEGIVRLLSASAGGPERLEFRQDAPNLAEIDAIVPGVGPALARVFDGAPRDDLPHNLRQVPNLVILAVGANIESLVVHGRTRRREHCGDRQTYVLHVDDWAPRCTIAHYQDLTGGVCPTDQVVKHN